MALVNLRTFLRCGQLVSENLLFSPRTIVLANMKGMSNANAAEETKKGDSGQQQQKVETASESNKEIEKLTKEISELTEKNNDLLDKYKRALADGENLRIRLTKQISEAKIFGIQSFCKDLLDVADVLNKATETVPKEEINDSNPHLKSLYEGLVMTQAQLLSVFKRHGIERLEPLNEKFNPNYHEALFQQEVTGKEAGTVVVVSKIGYKLHDRVIRPALVGVSK